MSSKVESGFAQLYDTDNVVLVFLENIHATYACVNVGQRPSQSHITTSNGSAWARAIGAPEMREVLLRR